MFISTGLLISDYWKTYVPIIDKKSNVEKVAILMGYKNTVEQKVWHHIVLKHDHEFLNITLGIFFNTFG